MTATKLFDSAAPARFCVGIDLGTTNCAVAYVDSQSPKPTIQQYQIAQLVDLGTIERRTTLPSFLYHFPADTPAQSTGVIQELNSKYCVGWYARTRGAEQPQRQIASAKSWLCHGGIDRTAKLLPWHADDDIAQMSPVAACSRYLAHIRSCWDKEHPDALLAEQDVVVTLPASFDEVARELTIEAAREAGLPKILLIEEPQAAFYAWLADHQNDWDQIVCDGQTILICDIGGGTTDFTLIRVREIDKSVHNTSAALEQQYGLHRVAVGDHLLLGGDNLDAALAAKLEQTAAQAGEAEITSRQWDSLRLRCRQAKETLLSESPPDDYKLHLPGTGRRLIDSGRNFIITRDDAKILLLDGFFPYASIDAQPESEQVGFREFGLPFAKDPAVTKHLAKFLWEHRFAGRKDDDPASASDLLAARPDWILFNGGVTSSALIRQRICGQIDSWFAEASGGDWNCGELKSSSLDLAVSRGAAYFALVRRGEGLAGGQGVRIDARLARAYFLSVQESPPRVLCVMPANAQTLEHHEFADCSIDVQVGTPVQFPLFYSSTRLIDRAGDIVDLEIDTMLPLPMIQTVLQGKRGKKSRTVPAIVESALSEIGTLQLYLHATSDSSELADQATTQDRWKLEFDLRSTVQTDRQHHSGLAERSGILSITALANAEAVITRVFDSKAAIPSTKNLMRELGDALELPRADWPASLLRDLWSTTIEVDRSLRKSPEAEARWLSLLGYFLRPGFGFAADDWRVAQTWRAVQGKLQNRGNASEAIILWRRIAGGFTPGQQQTLLEESRPLLTKITQANLSGVSNGYASELLRLVGSLELISATEKQHLVQMLLVALSKEKLTPLASALLWAVGRIVSRQPVYGPLNCVLSSGFAESIALKLLKFKIDDQLIASSLVQIARMTGDRYRDISQDVRQQVISFLKSHGNNERYLRQVQEVLQLDSADAAEILGESLPLGIQLRSI